MGAIVSRIISLGYDQIGYAENPLGSNRTKYGNFWDTPKSKGGPYPFFNGKKNGECGWCAEYTIWESAMALKEILGWDYDRIRVWLGMPKNPADNCGAGAPHLYKYMKKWEVDKTKGQPGDYIFFNTSLGECAHVGRIDSVSNGKYKTVEGNKSNKVGYGSYTISSTNKNIYAVIHVPYEAIEPKPDPSAVTYTVVTKYQPLEVRKEPTTKSEDVGDLAKGSTFTSSVVVKGESVHGCDAWVKVDKGYANGYYLSPTPVVTDPEPTPDPLPHPEPEPPKPVTQTYKVKTNTGAPLALRAAPNTKAACIVWMPNNSEVTVSDFVTGQKIGGCDQWARTTYKGRSGYCLSKYLTKA